MLIWPFVTDGEDTRGSPEDGDLKTLATLHAAWSRGDLATTLDCFTADLTYSSNIGSGGAPLVLTGREAFLALLETIAAHYACGSAILDLKWREGRAHARIAHSVTHKHSGYTLKGAFRQIATFRGRRIELLEEYYDAPKLLAFRRLVNRS